MYRVNITEITVPDADSNQHEHVFSLEEPRAGLRAFVAVHSTRKGPAVGGCRMYPYRSEEDALRDVLRLSRTMTLKNALFDLPFGGGKAVIIGEPDRDKTDALLLAMARGVHSLGGIYRTCDDMGTTVRDMDVMRTVTPFALGLPSETGEACPATAWGVVQAMRATIAHIDGRSLAGLRVGVQGLGKVGMRLCRYLAEAGAELVVADIRPELAEQAVAELGAVATAPSEILSAEVDVLAPCAVSGVLDDRTIPTLRCRAIVGAANDAIAAAHHADAIAARGVVFVPDFASSAGGMIDIAHEGPGYQPSDVLSDCGRIQDVVTEILERAARCGVTPSAAAYEMARARLSDAKA